MGFLMGFPAPLSHTHTYYSRTHTHTLSCHMGQASPPTSQVGVLGTQEYRSFPRNVLIPTLVIRKRGYKLCVAYLITTSLGKIYGHSTVVVLRRGFE